LIYRPLLQDAERFFEDKKYVWNLGYFVTTPKFLLSLFKEYTPNMYEQLIKISESSGPEGIQDSLEKIYPTLEKMSFDDAILQKISSDSNVSVISDDLGWNDIGTWEALKEALAGNKEDSATNGKVMLEDTKDSLVFNYTDKLCVAIDLDGIIIINTDDVLLICQKKSVPKIKKIVESLKGSPHEHLT
jgi:mannose-1-phosphate guanylyltransferase